MAVNLLLADDSPTIAKILDLALQTEDYAVRSVMTADAAQMEILKSPPDLFLVDIALPQKNGREFVKFIRNAPKLSHIRVVLLANAFDPVDEVALLKEGADGVIVKPFDPVALRTKLRQVMEAAPRPASPASTAAPIPPISDEQPPVRPATSLATAPATAPAGAPTGLSPYAKALADFFSAEVDAHKTAPPSPEPPKPPELPPDVPPPVTTAPSYYAAVDEGDIDVPPALPTDTLVSLEKREAPGLESGGLASMNQQDWTASDIEPVDSTQTYLGLQVQKPEEISQVSTITEVTEPPAGASVGENYQAGSAFFDTGGSTFRFSTDYVNRVLNSFTGATDEPVPQRWGKHPQLEEPQEVAEAAEATPLFPHAASDAAAPSGWTGMDVTRMEKMIREEVRLAVKEIVERVARDTIPKLAEQLIRAEIERLTAEAERTDS